MRDTNLLQLALGLTPPWTVTRSDFDPEAASLDIQIDFAPGSRFPCPNCGAADCPAYDTEQMTWRHLNFFQHQAYLNARVPRVRCDTCGVRKVHVPWARPTAASPAVRGAADDMVSAMPVRPWQGWWASTTQGCGACCITTWTRRGRGPTLRR